MTETSQALLALAEQDNLIQRSQLKLAKIPAQKEVLRKDVLKAEAFVGQLKQQQTTLQTQIRMREKLVELENSKFHHSEERMMTITNQKEFSALQKEMDAAKRTIKRTEDQILELEEQKEALQAQITEAQSALQTEEAKFQEAAKDLLAEESSLLAIIEQAQAHKVQFSASAEPELLGKYQALIERKLHPGALAISTPYCQGCAISIRPQIFNDLIRAGHLECPNCQRILFYQAPAPPEPKKKPSK